MKKTILKELLKQKGTPCISIIIPTSLKSFPNKQKNQLELRDVVKEIEMERENRTDITDNLLFNLKSLISKIDFNHLKEGVGIFVSPYYKALIDFPFPVKKRIVIDNTFDVRDVLFFLNKLINYNVLILSKGHTRFFSAQGDVLTEIIDGNFPDKYLEEFQYNRIRPARPGQQFYVREESKIDQVRLEKYLRSIDDKISKYGPHRPLIIMGVQKLMSTFKKISSHSSLIIGEIKGNYDYKPVIEISELVWEIIEKNQQKNQQEIIESAKNAFYKNRGVSGILQVWDAVHQGLGDNLIVEEDYFCTLNKKSVYPELIPVDSSSDNLVREADAVEKVIDTLLEQHDTEIHIVPNGSLKEFDKIILTTKF